MPSSSETLARWAIATRYEDLPPALIEKVKLHTLDLLGVSLAAAPLDFAQAARRVALAIGGAPRCTLVGMPDRLPAAWAGFVNGITAHGLDYDDTHAESVVHVNATVVPSALAIGEEVAASGRQFIRAVALGMEANIRIGLVAPNQFHTRGFHPTGVCGAYAAALVTSLLLELPAETTINALGLAGSQAAGTMEFLTDGTWSKRLHPGWAVHSGIIAACLAENGFTGPKGTFDGRYSLYRTHLGDAGFDVATLTDGLGTTWHALDTNLKPYPCCHMTHAFIDGAKHLQQHHNVKVEQIEQIECFISPGEVAVVCEPLVTKHLPQTDYDAKFSLPYCVASMLIRGHVDLHDFTAEAIRDEAVLALTRRVAYREDPQSDYPKHFGGWLRIHLRDGRMLEHHEPVNRGHAERPLSDVDVQEKFRANASVALDSRRTNTVVESIHGLEAGGLERLCGALAP